MVRKGLIQGLQGKRQLDVQESALFLRGGLNKGLYYKYKGRGYIIEVVTTAEKLQRIALKDFEDNLGEARS